MPPKRFDKPIVTFLTAVEIDALVAAPDQSRWEGRRDRVLLLLAIQTGLRVSELTGLNCADITLGTGANVRCEGKGRKQRGVPLTAPVEKLLRVWLTERAGRPTDPLFPTRTGRRLSRDAIALRVSTHAITAAQQCPTLLGKRIHPHVLRHSCVISPDLHRVRHVGHGDGRVGALRVSGTRLCRWLPSSCDRVDQRRVPGGTGGVAGRRRRVVGGARR
jgi:site-specific recombinase XerD